MLALGLQGSPRRKGNSDLLLSHFMSTLDRQGIRTHIVDVVRSHVEPCKELTACERTGLCPIDDEMGREIYPLLREADIIVAASPIFFYNVSAQLKALIDRCQALWARKYILKIKDPGHRMRRGFFMAVGASRGKQLFDGLHLTAKYFFDAVDAQYFGSLTYRGVEGRGEIARHETMAQDVKQAVAELAAGLTQRRKVLFAGRQDAGRSQMAAAFARLHGGELIDAACAGDEPAAKLDPVVVEAMQERGIDMGFRKPRSLAAAMEAQAPDELIVVGCRDTGALKPGLPPLQWDLPDPVGQPIDTVRSVRDALEQHVKSYIGKLPSD